MPHQNPRPRPIRTSSRAPLRILNGKHRFEHWYRDRQVYFITGRCRTGYPAFQSQRAKSVFWDRFHHYTTHYGFTPWVTSLLDNHYHTLGYLEVGNHLGTMMQRIHGSVAKLVNDLLETRLKPFWRDERGHNYFDGCIRNETQCRRAYRYTLLQSVRHGISNDWRDYPHTRVQVELERGIRRAHVFDAFLEHVPYKRYGERR